MKLLRKMVNSRDCLKEGTELLARAGISSPRTEVEIMLTHILDCEGVELYLDEVTIGEEERRAFENMISRRCRRVPLQYLTGEAFFAGGRYRVRPGVFIPRPETEILLQTACELIENRPISAVEADGKLEIADICTGCGNLAISLTRKVRHCKMQAADISRRALETARENAIRHQQQEKIIFLEGDLLSPLAGRFDLIVANPPYLSETEMAALEPEVRAEPRAALDGGKNGLDYLARLVRETPAHLKPGGYLVLEIGDGQISGLKEIFAASGSFSEIEARFDLNHRERVVYAHKKSCTD